MTFLLDVNVMIALLDGDHLFHDTATSWFAELGARSWATCPLTENGVLRILGHARYPLGPGTPGGAGELLRGLRCSGGHCFWPDEISLLDAPYVGLGAIGSASRVTDTYLLALAVARRGKLATFDRRLATGTVAGGEDAIEVIG